VLSLAANSAPFDHYQSTCARRAVRWVFQDVGFSSEDLKMPKPDDLARLNHHVLFSKLASLGVLLFGLIGFILYFRPSLAGVRAESLRDYQNVTIWLLAGMILTLLGATFLFISTRWPRQLKRTILHTLPTPMTVKLEIEEDSDSTVYYAVLSEREAGQRLAWRARIWVYPPKVKDDVGQQFEGSAFFHPETSRPVAIEYSRGVLWVMAGSGAVERLLDNGQKRIGQQRSRA
jgi:hypothetical protein